MPEGKPKSLASYIKSTEVGSIQISSSITLFVADFKKESSCKRVQGSGISLGDALNVCVTLIH